MKLLVPVDGSMASMNAVKKSIEIAQKYGFTIKLLHVIDLTKIMGTEAFVDNELLKIMREHSNELLDSIINKLDFHDIEVSKDILSGEPYEKIIETAKDENFDLIVMGNRGFSKIKRFFLGSVTQRVISEAPCPVLVIHSECD